jgi:hypothetical protein
MVKLKSLLHRNLMTWVYYNNAWRQHQFNENLTTLFLIFTAIKITFFHHFTTI